jgi:hypothetical protein
MAIATFESLASDFDRVADGFRVAVAGSADSHLVRELRRCAAVAGQLLIDAIERNALPPPSHPPFWLSIARGGHVPSFLELFTPGRESRSCGPVNSVEDLRYVCLRRQQEFDGSEDSIRLEQAWQPFVHRHVFFEAAEHWLGSSSLNALVPVGLPSWGGPVTSTTSAEFTSDWIENDWRHNAHELAMPLAGLCRDACRDLAERMLVAGQSLAHPSVGTTQSGSDVAPGAHIVSSEVPRKPWKARRLGGAPLRGWKDICAAIHVDHSRNKTLELRRLNDTTDGPIRRVGRIPEADRGELLAWLEDTDARASAREEARASKKAAADELAERDGARAAELGHHLEQRPNSRGTR